MRPRSEVEDFGGFDFVRGRDASSLAHGKISRGRGKRNASCKRSRVRDPLSPGGDLLFNGESPLK